MPCHDDEDVGKTEAAFDAHNGGDLDVDRDEDDEGGGLDDDDDDEDAEGW
jgi:hypothetical protein